MQASPENHYGRRLSSSGIPFGANFRVGDHSSRIAAYAAH